MDMTLKPLLEAKQLTKRFGKTVALDQINLSVQRQEIFGIIGLSGAGKSTLIRCLTGMISPTEGSVLFNGKEIATELKEFRKRSGMIFQHFNLLSSRTVEENVAYPLEIAHVAKPKRQKRIKELLQLVSLSSKALLYPATLSGGEKQRVAIARALANEPELLFCDEATSALDPKTTREILDLLRSINEKMGTAIVLITHDMEVIKRICSRVAVIESGKVIEEGRVSDLFAHPEKSTTRAFIQGASHEIPPLFFRPGHSLFRLRFKGEAAGEPVISQMIKRFDIHANILLGWIDSIQSITIGTLVVELRGDAEEIQKALAFLNEHQIHYEELYP